MVKNNSEPLIYQTISNRLHRRLWLYVTVGILITSMLIGSFFIVMTYRFQSKQLKQELLFNLDLETVALQSELTNLKNLVMQFTSRSHIRQELEKYLLGEISLENLIEFSKPKLVDAMQYTPEVIAINRLDKQGKLLIQVGEMIPVSFWPENYRSNTIQFGIPQSIKGRNILVLSAPILNRQGVMVGIDVVSFNSMKLFDIVQRFIRRQHDGNVRIGTTTSTGVQYFFKSGSVNELLIDKVINANVYESLTDIYEDVHILEGTDESIIIAHKRIGKTNWVFLFFDETKNFYAPARVYAFYIGIYIAVVTLIAVILTLFVVKSLSGRITVETDTLRHLLQENSDLLTKTQINEKRFQSIIDNTTSVIYLKDQDGKYLLINKRFKDLLHLSREQIIGHTDYDIFPADIADVFRANDLEVLQRNELIESDEHATHDDGIHDYLSIKFPLHNEEGYVYSVCGISTDITERKKNEKALLVSEERFDLAMQASNDGLWDWDLASNNIYYSPRWKSMLGYEEHELQNQFATWENLIDPDGKLKALALIEECLAGKRNHFSTDYCMRHKDGHWVDILARGISVRDDEGKVTRMVGTHVDISERIIEQKKLKDSDQRFRILFEMSPDPALIIDKHQFIECNQAAVTLLGYQRKDEFLNKHPSELSPKTQPDGQESFKKAERMMITAQEKGIHRFEWVHLRADNGEFYAEVTLSVITLLSRQVIYCTWRDITLRKEAELAISESRNILKTVIDTAPIRIFWKDLDLNYLGCNPAFASDVGLNSPEDIIGKNDSQLAWHEQAEDYQDDDRVILETGVEKIAYEESQTTVDGETIWLRISKVLLKDDNGVKFGILGIYEDITENKKANEAIQQNQAKSEFLANMSHELRTPMHGILSFARFGIKNIDKEDKAKNLKYFDCINSSGERLLVLLNDLLDLSKLEVGRMELSIEKNNLQQVFESCLSEQETWLSERNIYIKNRFEGNCLARFDDVRIGQVITNLLSNAIKFSPEGKTITASISDASIENKPALCFEIKDEGVGIPKDELDIVFDKFIQSSKTKTNAGGTGLGLSICKEIIVLHQGKIWAEHCLNGGVVIKFMIPVD